MRFGGLVALNGVNFEVQRDEIRAIIGPNGAGKSTFFNCLTGVLRPTSGRILFNGEDITGLPPDRISQKGIARSYQITNIFPTPPPSRTSASPPSRGIAGTADPPPRLPRHHRQSGGIGGGRPARPGDELAANLSRRAAQSRDRHRAGDRAGAPLPGRADRGHERAETHDTMALIRRIAQNLTILIVEHDMQVVMELAQRITVLHYGEVLAEGRRRRSGKTPGAGGLPQDMSPRDPPRQPLVKVEDIHTYYGKSHILHGSRSRSGGRGGGPARAQRRRQEHDAEDHHGPRPSQPGQGAVRGQAHHHVPAHRVARLGIGYVPEDRRIFRS